jgi:ribosomal protein S18 acetylase RimI-like enzyme
VSDAARLQTYFRSTARRLYDAVALPPFTLFLHPTEDLVYFNYAIPDEPVGGDLTRPLAGLRAEFVRRSRVPRLEYVEGFAPELAAALRAAGFELELQAPLMGCTPDGFRPPPEVPGLRLDRLDGSSPLDRVQDSITIARRAFGSGNEEPAAPEEAEHARRRLATDRRLIGVLDGEPVAVATALAPLEGLAEVAGVGVLTEFRGRGIGAALTAAAAETAFAAGAEVALLSPGDEGAMRLYRRIGFEPLETMVHYIDSDASGPS